MSHTKSLSLITLFASSAIFAVLALSGCPADESDKPKAPAAEVVKAPEKTADPAAAAPAATPTPAAAPAAPEPAKVEAKAETK